MESSVYHWIVQYIKYFGPRHFEVLQDFGQLFVIARHISQPNCSANKTNTLSHHFQVPIYSRFVDFTMSRYYNTKVEQIINKQVA